MIYNPDLHKWCSLVLKYRYIYQDFLFVLDAKLIRKTILYNTSVCALLAHMSRRLFLFNLKQLQLLFSVYVLFKLEAIISPLLGHLHGESCERYKAGLYCIVFDPVSSLYEVQQHNIHGTTGQKTLFFKAVQYVKLSVKN